VNNFGKLKKTILGSFRLLKKSIHFDFYMVDICEKLQNIHYKEQFKVQKKIGITYEYTL
jgi:hypothetical protein